MDEFSNTPDDSDFDYFIEVDLNYSGNIKERTKNFLFASENKFTPKAKYNDYMNKIKPRNYTKAKKSKCVWSDKKNYLIHYRMLKFYVRRGMVVEKVHEVRTHLNRVSGCKNR